MFQQGHIGYKYWLGKHLSEETKNKLRLSKKGKTYEQLYGREKAEKIKESIACKGKNHYLWGKHHSLETREKMSKARIGIVISKETREKISKSSKGKQISKKTAKKISIALTGKKISEKHRENLSKAHRGKYFGNGFKKGHANFKNSHRWKCGKNHHNWKGGITPLNHAIRTSDNYKQWRKSVFEKDNYKCILCREKGGYLHAHHIKSFATIIQENNIKTLQEALKCEELWDIKNGITLCKKHHNKGRKEMPLFFIEGHC